MQEFKFLLYGEWIRPNGHQMYDILGYIKPTREDAIALHRASQSTLPHQPHRNRKCLNNSSTKATQVLELLEDSVEFICDDMSLSGQKVWTMVYELAAHKVKEFPAE